MAGSADAPASAAANGQAAAAADPAGSWAQFDAPTAAAAPGTPEPGAAAAGGAQAGGAGGGGGVSGWQAFGEPGASANGDAEPHAAAPAQPPMRKELPSVRAAVATVGISDCPAIVDAFEGIHCPVLVVPL